MWFQIDNLPPSGLVSNASFIRNSSLDMIVSFDQNTHYSVYARISDNASYNSSLSLEEFILRDQSPFQEIISGLIGSKEKPAIMGVSGSILILHLFLFDKSLRSSNFR
jgi:hypothetical protein